MKSASIPKAKGRNGAATLVEVAAQAGVSAVAASVVLNGSRTGTRVSPATRDRILEAAALLQYAPNAVARALRKQSTDVVAFYNDKSAFFDPRYPFFGAILAGIAWGCEEHRKDLHLHGHFRDREDQDIYMALLNGQIDGLVLYARTVTPLIERLVQSRLPVVSIVEEVPGVPYVGIDEAGGSRLLARHLKEKGYKRVMHCRTDEVLPSTLQDRFEAFCAEAALLDLEIVHSKAIRVSTRPHPRSKRFSCRAARSAPMPWCAGATLPRTASPRSVGKTGCGCPKIWRLWASMVCLR